MIKEKIKGIKDTLDLFPTERMKLEYFVDLGKKSQKEFPEEYKVEDDVEVPETNNV